MPSTSALPWLGNAPPTPARRAPRRRRALPVRRLRRIAAALLVGLAAWLAIGVLRPAPPPHTVLTVAADLPAGHVVADGDVSTAHVDAPVRPEGALERPDQVVGRRLGRSTAARTILTESAFAPKSDLADNERAVHVPVADPGALRSLRPGDLVDLVEAGGGSVVAASVRVLVVDDPSEEKGGHGVLVAAPQGAVSKLVPAMAAGGPGVTPALRTR